MANGFNDIIEELQWEMCKMSEGNPYILQELVKDRNLQREKAQIKTVVPKREI